jgi:hypothetical protein
MLCVSDIYQGREWLDTEGLEPAGRVSYKRGLSSALELFREVQENATADLETPIITEKAYLTQELQFCAPSDKQTRNSLTTAIQSFDDSQRSLKIVMDPALYKIAEQTYPTILKLRHNGMPKDAFHIACDSHRTRLGNILRVPGINLKEKSVLEQRLSNINTIQIIYQKLQEKVFKN